MMISYPDRLPLARTPTPLEPLAPALVPPEVEMLVKRDDQSGAVLSGNKVRKLEFLLAEARAQEADLVITCGGAQSNHARATAIAARGLGLDAELVLRTEDPARPPPPEGNILLDRLVGARIHWIDHAAWLQRTRIMKELAERLRGEGRRPYVIPEGGSNEVGAWGYVRCAEELAGQLPPGPATVVSACGSGGTTAGLLAGVTLLDLPWRVVGINVCNDRAYFLERFDLPVAVPAERIEIIEGYVGRGYARSRPEELAGIVRVARSSGLILDPVYTGKAFLGLLQELAREPTALGERVVFLHTGGVFGLLPVARDLAPQL
jgi:D-cysteine desulfhydrase